MKLHQKAVKHRMAGHREPPILRAGALGHLQPIKSPPRMPVGRLKEWLTSDARTLTIGRNSLWRDNGSVYLLRGGKQYHFQSADAVWEFYFAGKEF